MPYIKQEIISGDVYEAYTTFSARYGTNGKRKSKNGKTTAKQKIINEKNAKRKVARLINTNFTKGDIFLTLTYEYAVKLDQAKKDLVNFLRRIKYFRKKNNLPDIKYIAVTESEGKRVHHHIIMTKLSLDVISDNWVKGKAIIGRLYPDKDYTGIAKYITKEPAKEFAKRWTQSRNLDKPEVRTKQLKTGRGVLKVPKGYKLMEQRLDYTEWTGYYQYMRCIRIGGIDYCEGYEDGMPGALVNSGLQKVHRKKRDSGEVQKSKDANRRA